MSVPEISRFDHRCVADQLDALQAGDRLQIDSQRHGPAGTGLYTCAEHDGGKDQRSVRYIAVTGLEGLRETLRGEMAVRMGKGPQAPRFLVPHIVRVGTGAQIVAAPLVPIVPEPMNYLHVVVGRRCIDLNQVECRVEAAGRDAGCDAGEVAIGNERMIHLNHDGAQAPRLPEYVIDRGGAGIDRGLIAEGKRVGVEMAPRCRQLDGRDEWNAAAGGDLLQCPVIDGRIVIADEQKIQAGRKLGARQIRRRRDCLRLVGVMVQVGRIPTAGRRVEKRREKDFFLQVAVGADGQRHLLARS